jgi:hypothetical protein
MAFCIYWNLVGPNKAPLLPKLILMCVLEAAVESKLFDFI